LTETNGNQQEYCQYLGGNLNAQQNIANRLLLLADKVLSVIFKKFKDFGFIHHFHGADGTPSPNIGNTGRCKPLFGTHCFAKRRIF
jgi:hypothetical protein